MKVLFAGGNFPSSKTLLARIALDLKQSNITTMFAGYDKHIPASTPYHWNLQSLRDLFRKSKGYPLSNTPPEWTLYKEFIENGGFDFIITDFDRYTMDIALSAGIPMLICSNRTMTLAQNAVKTGVIPKKICTKFYQFLRDFLFLKEGCEKSLFYSHFSDVYTAPPSEHYCYIRPYCPVPKDFIPSNKLVWVLPNLIPYTKLVAKYPGSIVYTEDRLCIKDVEIVDLYNPRYFLDLAESRFVISDGDMITLSDAYYCGKFSYVIDPFMNLKTIDPFRFVATNMSVKYGLAQHVLDYNKFNFNDVVAPEIEVKKREDVQTLIEHFS